MIELLSDMYDFGVPFTSLSVMAMVYISGKIFLERFFDVQ